MIDVDKILSEMLSSKTVIIITGPTATGKTDLSLSLAKLLPIEVISADSRQIYKFMNIGTAKPSIMELKTVKHHFIDYITPDIEYNAGRFGDEAEKTVLEIFNREKLPVIVGGSGLYIQSLCEGLFSQKENFALQGIRTFLTEKLNEKGKEYMYEELEKVDKRAAELYKDKNPRRVLRALEYYYTYGASIVDSRKEKRIERGFKCKYFAIEYDRHSLYERINKRALTMWQDGLVDEAQKILDMGYSQELNSLNTVGYKEAFAYLNKKLTENEAISEIQKNTRRYAKRQLTWFKKMTDIYWFNTKSYSNGEIPALEILKRI